MARARRPGGAAIPAQCRHHRRGHDGEGAVSAKPRATRPGTVLPRGRILGEIEEYFAETLTPRDTFLFAGEVLRFEGIVEDEVLATRAAAGTDPKIPSYDGGKFPLSTFLAARVRAILADSVRMGPACPPQMTEWLLQQRRRSGVPGERDLLVETFPRGGRYYMTCFPFEGRPAHQTLGMLLTRRMDRAGLKPFGYVANDYGSRSGAMSTWRPGSPASRTSSTTSSPRTCLATISRTGWRKPR